MPEPQRPENQPAKSLTGGGPLRPEQYDAEMAAAAMATDMVKRLGTPSIVSKKFVVYSGIWQALNHTEQKPTGYDTSLRIAVYNKVAEQSVNVDGKYFDSFWQFMMKPKYVLTGTPMQGQFEKPESGIIQRTLDWVRGRKPEEQK